MRSAQTEQHNSRTAARSVPAVDFMGFRTQIPKHSVRWFYFFSSQEDSVSHSLVNFYFKHHHDTVDAKDDRDN